MSKNAEKRIFVGLGLIQSHFRRVFVGIVSYGRKRHLRWLPIYSWDNHAPGRTEVYDGAVLSGPRGRTPRERMKCPWVQVSAIETPGAEEITVLPDNREIGRIAGEHFLERGFREFAFFGTASHLYSRERLEGFRERVGRCRVYDFPAKEGRDFAGWLRELPQGTALFCSNDIYARTAIKTLREGGRQVPEEVAVVGVDNDEIENLLSEIPISSIDMRSEVVGETAAEILEGLMHGKRPEQTVTRVAPGGLVVRQSSDILWIGDPRLAAALAIIREGACEGMSVEEVARQTGVSRRTLERRFQEVLGRGIEAEMRRVRLQRAKQLLSETDFSLREVAEKAGFSDVFYFSTAFRKAETASPGEWRRENRNLKMASLPAGRQATARPNSKPMADRRQMS